MSTETKPPPAIELNAIELRLQRHFWTTPVDILRGVDLNIAQGEVFGFLGPNGAGKTTTIKTILGLMRPNSGTVRVFGGSIHSNDIRARIGFMPEHAYFPPQLSALEYMSQHARLAGIKENELGASVVKTLERVGMLHRQHKRLGECSKGMLQRVGIGQALLGDPDLVVLDEPMTGLDPEGRKHMHDIIRELGSRGKTVFFSTHILPDVETLCDRIGIMVAGRVTRQGRLHEFKTLERSANKARVELAFRLPSTADGTAPRNPEIEKLRDELTHEGYVIAQSNDYIRLALGNTEISNTIIQRALKAGLQLENMSSRHAGLEEVFLAEIEASGSNPTNLKARP